MKLTMRRLIVTLFTMCFLCAWALKVQAAEEFTKGVMLNSAPTDSNTMIGARLSELSPAAIEKGLKDAQLLARPSFDKKTRVMKLQWHSLSKTLNGTEHSKSLTEPLITQLKLPNDVNQIGVGQEITLKGDLDSMLEDFDVLLRQANESVEVNSEKNDNSSVTNETADSSSSDSSGSGSGSSGGDGYLSEGGLTENPELEEGALETDKITTSTEQCSLNVDWGSNSVFKQERKIKTSESGENDEIGDCYNVGKAYKIEKDFAASCNVQINGLTDYAKGFISYSFVDGERVELSGCTYDANDKETLILKNDFKACGLDTAQVNLADNNYYLSAIKYSMINGKRYNLTECEVINDEVRPLPTKIETCPVKHDLVNSTSYSMERTDVYDPQNKTLLKKGDCVEAQSFPIEQDFAAACPLQFRGNGAFIRGFKLFTRIDNTKYDLSECTYTDENLAQAELIKDYDVCSIDKTGVSVDAGLFYPAFMEYVLVDGERYDQTGCITNVEDNRPLPTRLETCPIVHDSESLSSITMERTDIYDPTNKELLRKGECTPVKTYAYQKDFNASCSVKINGDKFIRGFKYFSSVEGTRYDVSECQYDKADEQVTEIIKDYDVCSIDKATIDSVTGVYYPAFVNYTLIDGQRYDQSGCVTAADDSRPLPTRLETCPVVHDSGSLQSTTMERIDTYNPSNTTRLKEGECTPVKNYAYQKDFAANCPVTINGNKFIRGYKYFSNIEGTRYDVSECQYDKADEQVTEIIKDYEVCSIEKATIDSVTGVYYPAFVNYALIDGERYDQSGCITAADDSRPLPTRLETCPIVHDQDALVSSTMERTDIYDPTNKQLLKTGACTVVKNYPFKKDFAAGCDVKVTASNFLRGYKYYSMIDATRYDVSACQYDQEDAENTEVFKDYDSCSIDNAKINVEQGNFEPSFTQYTLIDGKRYDLSPCITEPTDTRPLPTRLEQCEIEHDLTNNVSRTRERTDIYDPTNKQLLKTGDCTPVKTANFQKDFAAGCDIKVNNDTFVRGFKFFSIIDGTRYDVSACQYDDADKENTEVFKDYDSCSIDNAKINLEQGNFEPAFSEYTLIDGDRFNLSPCKTAADDVRPLPTRLEQCDIEHDLTNNVSRTMQRTDVYDPSDKQRLKTGECTPVKTFDFQKDFNAGCSVKIKETTFVRGFKFFSVIDGERHDVSACQFDDAEEQAMDVFKDYAKCPIESAKVNLDSGNYEPAFTEYTLIDGTRYEVSPCKTAFDDVRPLPTRLEQCDIEHDLTNDVSSTMQRTDIYDPSDRQLLSEGECLPVKTYPIYKDFDAKCSIQTDTASKTYTRGYKKTVNIEGKESVLTPCTYDVENALVMEILKNYETCSLDDSIIQLDNGSYLPPFEEYAIIDGARKILTPCKTAIDDVRPLPTRLEQCDLSHDLSGLKTHRMQRTDTYNPTNKDVLKTGNCESIEEFPIQQDFDAGCSIQINNVFNTYNRGFKYFSIVDTKKHVLSECEYAGEAVAFETFKDYSNCSLDEAIIDLTNDRYQPAFIKYSLIDNERYELTGCITEEKDTKPLPKRLAVCEMNYDYPNMIAHNMERVQILTPDSSVVLREDECYSIQEREIFRDYDNQQCLDIPNYTEKEIALGYKHYYKEGTKKEYIGECGFDIENKKPLLQEVGSCRPSENLTTLTTTINKVWFWMLEDGSKEHITECGESDETYPIIDTSNTCSPQFIASTGEVIVQKRKGWVDSSGTWHYVTNCTPSDDTTTVLKEWCSAPAYEHDFVGGQSYKRSRNYYMYEGKRVYINGCSRDSESSIPHSKSTSGCNVQHEDNYLRSRINSKTLAVLDGVSTVIKACEPESQYIPYQFTGKAINTKTAVAIDRGTSSHHYGTIKTVCDNAGASITNVWGKGYKFSPNSSTSAPVINYKTIETPNSCANCSNPGVTITRYYHARSYITANVKEWRRTDGSLYKQYMSYVCSKD